jgi:glutamate-1-semialdehyde 2,1-aminomutase
VAPPCDQSFGTGTREFAERSSARGVNPAHDRVGAAAGPNTLRVALRQTGGARRFSGTLAAMSDETSRALFERAQAVIPGGVNSPVRAFRAVGGSPVFIARAEGAYLYGADGKRYTDYIGSWGPMILGHAHPDVIQAIARAAQNGTSFGAPTEGEVLFAERITKLYPSIEMVRAVSSGTEATMAALRVARGFTGRDLIVKFEGCYHGHADFLLVKAGSGLATLGVPDSAGVPQATASGTLTLPYNDVDALRALFDRYGKDIAAVIVEPVVGNMGCVPPAPGFLEAILELCKANGAVSIFDEVMTGCRLSPAGMQGRAGLRPDMTCLGKIVGGGMPLAAYGGRRAIMEKVAPLGPVYQAGTLSGNPVAVAAALATLDRLDDRLYAHLETLGARLEAGLSAVIRDKGLEACVQRVGSMITLFFARGPVRSWDDAKACDTKRFAAFHAGMLARGQYWPPSQFEAAFLSGAHTVGDIDQTIEAARASLG